MSEALGNQKEKHFIVSNNLWKVMFRLSWPAVIAMVLYGFNTVLDAIFVGRFVGETALAGVSLAYPLTQMALGAGSLIGVGAGSVLSIALGAHDLITQKRLLGNVNVLTVIVTLVFMIPGLLFATQLITMMGGTADALSFGVRYFRVTVLGALFWIYGLSGNMMIRAEGRMKTAALMMGIGLVVNAIANYVLIVLCNMGVEGAAWGTNIAMLVYTLLGWFYFSSGRASFKSKLLSFHLNTKIAGSILRLGASSMLMTLMTLVQAVVVFNALSQYGTTADIAFYGVVYRVFQFLLTPVFGLMRALQPVLGINYGAKQYDRVIRAYKIFAVTAMLLTLPFWVLSLAAPGSVLGLMLSDQLFTGAQFTYFRIYMAILPLMSFIFMGMTLFPSIDKGKPAAIIGIARQLIFYVPVMLLLPRFIGVSGIYYGSLAIDSIILLWTMLLVKKEFTNLRSRSLAERGV